MPRLVMQMAVVLALVGCATAVPIEAFKTYTDAFDGMKAESETLLIELDRAFKLEAARTAKEEASKANAVVLPFPMRADGDNPDQSGAQDVMARRRSLEVVSSYNTVLTQLAAGRSPDEVRASATSLIGGLNQLGGILGLGAGTIPFAGQVGDLIGTASQKLREARNRADFVAGLRTGAPVVGGILGQLQKDANLIYRIRALDARSRALDGRRRMSDMVLQMTQFARTLKAPTDKFDIANLADVQTRLNNAIDEAKLAEPGALETTGAAPFDKVAITQLQQTLTQLEQAGAAVRQIVAEQAAFYDWVQSFKAMIGETAGTLNTVVAALDQPVDLNVAAADLTGYVFQVKRDFEALRDARAAAGG